LKSTETCDGGEEGAGGLPFQQFRLVEEH